MEEVQSKIYTILTKIRDTRNDINIINREKILRIFRQALYMSVANMEDKLKDEYTDKYDLLLGEIDDCEDYDKIADTIAEVYDFYLNVREVSEKLKKKYEERKLTAKERYEIGNLRNLLASLKNKLENDDQVNKEVFDTIDDINAHISLIIHNIDNARPFLRKLKIQIPPTVKFETLESLVDFEYNLMLLFK